MGERRTWMRFFLWRVVGLLIALLWRKKTIFSVQDFSLSPRGWNGFIVFPKDKVLRRSEGSGEALAKGGMT